MEILTHCWLEYTLMKHFTDNSLDMGMLVSPAVPLLEIYLRK